MLLYASQFTQFPRELLNWRLRNLATSHCKLIHTCNSHIICIRVYSIPERIAAWGYSNFQLQTNSHIIQIPVYQFLIEFLNLGLRNPPTSNCKLIHNCNSHIMCVLVYSIPERIAALGAEKSSNCKRDKSIFDRNPLPSRRHES
jgi:hypothetical protein